MVLPRRDAPADDRKFSLMRFIHAIGRQKFT
jgi:hypothetical protein